MKETIIENRKAYHDYFVNDTMECGIELKGNEVKSIREGKANLKGAWCRLEHGEVFILGMNISKWQTSNTFDINEERVKKLLLHRKEIEKLERLVKLEKVQLIPLKVYFVRGKVKVLIGICKGKHNYDKRNVEAKKQATRNIERALKVRNKT